MRRGGAVGEGPGLKAGDERGGVAALVIVALPVLVFMLGLVVDMAYLFTVRTVMQNAADMAALAAAQNVDLPALAMGERRLLNAPALHDAEQWGRSNLERHPLTRGLPARVVADVYNASPDAPLRHRTSGRRLHDPTVSVRIELTAPLFFARMIVPEVALQVMADASVLQKADPLPYTDDP